MVPRPCIPPPRNEAPIGAAAIVSLVLGSLSTLSALITPLIVARRAAAAASAAQAAAAAAAAAAPLSLPPGSVIPAGVPMPAAVVVAPAAIAPAPAAAAPGAHPVLDDLVKAVMSHQFADLLGQFLGGALAVPVAAPPLAGPTATPVGVGAPAPGGLAQVLAGLEPEILAGLKLLAQLGTPVAAAPTK